ncbi:MAG: ribonuclease D [Rhizobium sp.]|nr:MAG: ribonuclease D [Rhizobium sp.]
MPKHVFIQTADALQTWLARWGTCPWLAVDTEFVRVDTYYPKLCLVQIGDGETSVCVDAITIKDLKPLFDLLNRKDILKVFHAASQDLEIFVELSGTCPSPIFDTQTAATMLSLGDQMGYAALVEKRCGVVLDKSLTRTDWSRRPLTEAELDYAALDVHYLAEIYPVMREELAAANRLAWLEEDCARAAIASNYLNDPADAWRRLKGLARLSPRAQVIAAALAEWREKESQQRNRPRKWIIEDDAIYRMSERAPESMEQLEALNVLPPKTLARQAETLLKVIAGARALEPRKLANDDRLEPEIKARVGKLQDRLRTIATTLQVPASMLAPRADVEALALSGADAEANILKGWRRDAAGKDLLSLL